MARYPQPTAQAAYLDDSSPNLGAIYENVIAQELTAQGIPLYYYMAKEHGEVDFIADTNADSVMPFEVKSAQLPHARRHRRRIGQCRISHRRAWCCPAPILRRTAEEPIFRCMPRTACEMSAIWPHPRPLQHHRRLFAHGAPRVGFASVRALPLRAQGVEGVIEARAKPAGLVGIGLGRAHQRFGNRLDPFYTRRAAGTGVDDAAVGEFGVRLGHGSRRDAQCPPVRRNRPTRPAPRPLPHRAAAYSDRGHGLYIGAT